MVYDVCACSAFSIALDCVTYACFAQERLSDLWLRGQGLNTENEEVVVAL